MKKLIPILLATLLLLTACTSESPDPNAAGEILVYRVVREDYRTGSELLRAEKLTYADESVVVRGAAVALKSNPEDASLSCALPAAVSILKAERTGRTAYVHMNSAYDALTGIEKTIADSCITLTMCSIDGIDYAAIFSSDGTTNQRLSTEDILLKNTLTSSSQADLRLYFPKTGSGLLAAESRPVTISGETSSARIVIDELLKGPVSERLSPALPEGTVLLSVNTRDGVCTVSFSEDFQHGTEDSAEKARLAIYSVVNSLTSLTEIDSVRIIVQNSENTLIGGIDISAPLTRKSSMIGSAVID